MLGFTAICMQSSSVCENQNRLLLSFVFASSCFAQWFFCFSPLFAGHAGCWFSNHLAVTVPGDYFPVCLIPWFKVLLVRLVFQVSSSLSLCDVRAFCHPMRRLRLPHSPYHFNVVFFFFFKARHTFSHEFV